MNVVFVSNYFSHHQKSFSDAMAKLVNSYCFIATAKPEDERIQMGWCFDAAPDYVHYWNSEKDELLDYLEQADAIIVGSAPEYIVKRCIRNDKLVLRYSERPLKKGIELKKYLPRFVKWHWNNPVGKPIYLLSASAYAFSDYAKFGLFWKRAYKWGYFPELLQNTDIERILKKKQRLTILWAGRFIEWKHPDDAMLIAIRLKEEGYKFTLNLIGMGQMEEELKNMIEKYQMEDCVHLLGKMSPREVQENMRQTGIFLFTSDRREGWGAVLNEAMGNGCAVIASHSIGAVPFLVRDGSNGLVYYSGDLDMLYSKLKYLLEHPEIQLKLGQAAYHTIQSEWNGEVAAKRLVNLIRKILEGNKYPDIYLDGPCSKANVIQEDWYIQ